MDQPQLSVEKLLTQVEGLSEAEAELERAIGRELGSVMMELLVEEEGELPAGVAARVERFRASARECKEQIAGLPKGQRLEPYLSCMSKSLRLKEAEKTKTRPSRDQVRVEVWEERDRLHIGIQDKQTGNYVISWWDDEAREMFEDGFFKRGPGLAQSVLDYAQEQGFIGP